MFVSFCFPPTNDRTPLAAAKKQHQADPMTLSCRIMVFLTIILARTLDSLVRVPRRVDRNHFVKRSLRKCFHSSRDRQEPEILGAEAVPTIELVRSRPARIKLRGLAHLFSRDFCSWQSPTQSALRVHFPVRTVSNPLEGAYQQPSSPRHHPKSDSKDLSWKGYAAIQKHADPLVNNIQEIRLPACLCSQTRGLKTGNKLQVEFWTSKNNWFRSFPSQQFQALFDSFFKVLCIFPSRYLCAIGLPPVFSFGWKLPPGLGLHSQAVRLDKELTRWCAPRF